MSRAEHRLHLRCEVAPDDAVEARRALDRPAAGRADVDQRPHAGPAPVPRSGEAQALPHEQIRHDRRRSSSCSAPARSELHHKQRRPASPRDRGPRPGPRAAAGQPRRRHARACRGGGRERHDHRRVPDHAGGCPGLARGAVSPCWSARPTWCWADRTPATSPPSTCCATARPTSCRPTMCRRA